MFSTAALIAGLLAGPPVVWEGSLVVEKCEWVTDNFVTCRITFSPGEIPMTNAQFNEMANRLVRRYVRAPGTANYWRAKRAHKWFPVR